MTGEETRLPGEDALDIQVMTETPQGWRLQGSRCPRCSRVFYPARLLCPDDLAECEVRPLSGEGVLYAAAQVKLGPQGFEAPYWVAWVDLPEGVRVYTMLDVDVDVDVDVDGAGDPQPGTAVTLCPRVVRTEPYPVLGPVFRLADATPGR